MAGDVTKEEAPHLLPAHPESEESLGILTAEEFDVAKSAV